MDKIKGKQCKTEFEIFKQSILKTSLINTIMAESNPEICQFLHLPEIDPTIVWGYDKEIVSSCIDQHIKFYIQSFNMSIVDRISKEIKENHPTLKEKVEDLNNNIKQLRDYILALSGKPHENEKEAETAWIALQKKQIEASDEIAKSYEELPGWSNWFKRVFKYGILTLFMSNNTLSKAGAFVSTHDMIKEQNDAIRQVNEKQLSEHIEEVRENASNSIRPQRD